MKKTILTLITLTGAVLSGHAQTDIFVARHEATLDGIYNSGRVRLNATFDGTDFGQWTPRGNTGTTGDGRVWSGFSRYKMDERDLFNKINSAGQITWTTGLIQKEKNRTIEPESGGHDSDVYLILDPTGRVVPSGQEPSHLTAWDWANQFGWGYDHTVYLGRILQTEPMATEAEKTAENQIPVDSPAMRITFDVTDHLKNWIQEGLLTANSTIAVGLVQLQAVISDGEGNPKFDDPNLYIHSQMVFEVGNAYIQTSAGAPKGPAPFDDYDLVQGYVDTGAWMGWVYVAQAPWVWVVDLNKWAYVNDKSGWVYIPK